MDYTFLIDGNTNHSTIETNSLGDKIMYENGQSIATQKEGIFPETSSTYEDGYKIAATHDNIIDGTDIIQNGEHTGIIKEDIDGHVSLYDSNYQKLAYINSEGNVMSVMNHSDPLSQVDRINFQQLQFYSEG